MTSIVSGACIDIDKVPYTDLDSGLIGRSLIFCFVHIAYSWIVIGNAAKEVGK